MHGLPSTVTRIGRSSRQATNLVHYETDAHPEAGDEARLRVGAVVAAVVARRERVPDGVGTGAT